jgi:3-isopropylmalate dehydrogenase
VREASVALLAGDGIGLEVVAVARELVDVVAADHGLAVRWHEHLVGGASIDAHGTALTDEVLEACAGSDAVLLGAVGGPRWDTTDPAKPRPEQGLLGLRAGLGLYANLRPVRPWPALYEASPLRRERIEGTDLLVVRELTGGIYFGERGRQPDRAFDTCVYTLAEVERLAEWGFRAAAGRRGKVTSVDKANVLETSRLWREQVNRTAAAHPGIELEHMLVDNAAMQLVSRPADFDVIVTENLFGDVLSDEAAMITGSIGLLPSASLGPGSLGLYEPVHGSAPDIAGTGVANPIATCLSAAMMLRYSLDAPDAADRLEAAVDAVVEGGARTRDLGGDLGTEAMRDRLAEALR